MWQWCWKGLSGEAGRMCSAAPSHEGRIQWPNVFALPRYARLAGTSRWCVRDTPLQTVELNYFMSANTGWVREFDNRCQEVTWEASREIWRSWRVFFFRLGRREKKTPQNKIVFAASSRATWQGVLEAECSSGDRLTSPNIPIIKCRR